MKNILDMRICKTEGCPRKVKARGLCSSCYNKQWYKNNRQKRLDYIKQWRKDNPDYQKQWRKDNPDYQKQWRKDNAERIRKTSRKWHKDNRDYVNARKVEYYHSRKPKTWTVYGIHLNGSTKILRVGMTKRILYQRLAQYRHKHGIPDLQIRPIVSNIATKGEARQLENDYIIRYDTIENGWNKFLNNISN